MTLIGLLFALVVVGILLYCVNQFVPMDAKIKTIINIIVVLAVVFWLLQAFGLLSGGPILGRPLR